MLLYPVQSLLYKVNKLLNFIISFINFIMTSQSNTFRLQRLTKTIGTRELSQSQYEPKQTFKLAALNSITKGIKYNELSYVSGMDLNKLRKQPEPGQDLLYGSAHSNLAGVRKNYDSAHKQKTARELSISKLKQQKNKLWINERELLDNKTHGSKSVQQLQKDLEDKKLQYIEADMQKKVLLSMRARLKSDKIVYDQRKFNMEKQLRFLRKQKQVISVDKNQIFESDDRTVKVYKKFLNQLKAQQDERDAHINSIRTMIQQKQRSDQMNQFRGNEMTEIAERAMQDKDDNQKNWQKLYLTNKLLARLLRSKMDKQMNKFFIVQAAFKTIKIATGVSDAETLVQKFLNKQSAYGDLLGKIAENEKRIVSLKEQGDRLRKQFKELQAEKQVIDSTKKVAQSVDKELKILTEFDHRQEKSFIYREKIRAWISKTNKKINSILGKQYQTNIDRSIKGVTAAFIEYLKNLTAEIQATKQIQIKEEVNLNVQGSNNYKKNIRISNNKQDQYEQEIIEDNSAQSDAIYSQRLEILRSNEKFMRDARRKFQEKKKIAVQNSSPKKQPVAEKAPVKPVQPVD